MPAVRTLKLIFFKIINIPVLLSIPEADRVPTSLLIKCKGKDYAKVLNFEVPKLAEVKSPFALSPQGYKAKNLFYA